VTRVIKLGGRAQNAPELVTALATEWRRPGAQLCVVHGGGEEISAVQRALGGEPAFVGGRRVTTPRDLDIVRMVLSGTANKRLVTALVDQGVWAWGISGEDAGLLEADPLPPELGSAGVPSRVHPDPLELLLKHGYLPVVSPMARNATGPGGLNVNGDDAAAALASALHATELLFVSDVPGVTDGAGTVLSELTISDARELIATGAASGGMAAKLEAAERALATGVRRVRIADMRAVSDPTAGTTITAAREALV
jgi:acetylglutamate kinase